MKYCLFLWLFLLVGMVRVQAAAGDVIRVSTAATDLIFRVGTDGRLYQAYWGERLLNDSDLGCFSGNPLKVGRYTSVPAWRIILNRLWVLHTRMAIWPLC